MESATRIPIPELKPEHEAVLYDIQHDLCENIHPQLDAAWELNEALLQWMHATPRASAAQVLVAIHFGSVSAWIESLLLRQSMLGSKKEPHTDKLFETAKALQAALPTNKDRPNPVFTRAQLGLLSLTRGIQNIHVVDLAEGLLWLLEEAPDRLESAVPDRLYASLDAIAEHLNTATHQEQPEQAATESPMPVSAPSEERLEMEPDVFGEERRYRRHL